MSPGNKCTVDVASKTSKFAVTAKGLTKRFGEITAVDRVDLKIRKGEVFGILGPNGAGKTTLIEMLEGLQISDAGDAKIFGHNVSTESLITKQVVGAQLQSSSYFDHLSLTELLELFGGLYTHHVPASTLLDEVGLTEKASSRVRSLSGGQKQRFTIATALVNSPSILFLDEPTSGLDPQARHNIWNLVRRINSENRTIILTTHMMEEAEELCNRVAIMDHGKVIAMGTPSDLAKSSAVPYQIEIKASSDLDLSDFSPQQVTVYEEYAYSIKVSNVAEAILSIQSRADQQQIAFEITEVHRQSLEDAFLQLTGRELRD